MRLTLEDGKVVNTEKATAEWDEATFWDGRNHVSKATGSQWEHETLYRSAAGRFYVVHTSQWQGSRDRARLLQPVEAARWLLLNEHELPQDLAGVAAEAEE